MFIGQSNTRCTIKFDSSHSFKYKSVINKPIIPNFIDLYSFYILEEFQNTIVADVLDKNKFNGSIVSLYMKEAFTEITPQYEITFVTTKNSKIIKSIYIPSENEITSIKDKAVNIKKNNPIYSRLVTSYNYEINYKYKVQKDNTSFCYLASTAGNVNSQSVLDNYLSTFNYIQEEFQIGKSTDIINRCYGSDDPIINLISKSTFTTNGKYSGSGTEWGYYANTFTDEGNNKITSLIIYDITCLKTDFYEPETVQIKPVLAYNYKYHYSSNTVYKDSPNNYCLANPHYRFGIQYRNFDNNKNSIYHPNRGEQDYVSSKDNGFCIGTRAIKMIGVGKNYTKSVKNIAKVGAFIGNMALNVASAKIPILGNVLVSSGIDFISDKAVNFINDISSAAYDQYYLSVNKNKEGSKFVYNSININGAGSFEKAKELNKNYNFFESKLPDSNNEFQNSNLKNPLLFKTNEDSINYQIQLYDSELSDDYTALLCHKFDCDVLIDDTWLFKQNPTYLSKIESTWSYAIGENVTPSLIKVNETNSTTPLLFGTKKMQEVIFTPQKSGNYSILLKNAPYSTYISFNNESRNTGRYIIKDVWNNSRESEKNNSIRMSGTLIENTSYRICVWKAIGNNNVFGVGNLEIKLNGEDFSIQNGQKQNSYNVNNQGDEIIHRIEVGTSGLYTILNTSTSTNTTDTYVTLLDQNFTKIVSNDDGWSNRTAGIIVNLSIYTTYYLLTKFFSSTATGTYNISIYNERYLPEMRDEISEKSLLLNDFGKEKTKVYLVCQSITRTITFQTLWDDYSDRPNVGIRIKDYKNATLKEAVDIEHTNGLTFTFNSNQLYIILIYTSSTTMSNHTINLYCKGQ